LACCSSVSTASICLRNAARIASRSLARSAIRAVILSMKAPTVTRWNNIGSSVSARAWATAVAEPCPGTTTMGSSDAMVSKASIQ
jgi:hypothetical protein